MEIKSINEYNKNIFTEINNTWGILVAGEKNIDANGMTVSWGGAGILWNKNVLFLFVRKSRYTYEFLQKTNHVSLCFLSDSYKDAKIVFGRKSGRDIDKFSTTGLTKAYDSNSDTYYIGESDTVFIGNVIYKKDITFEEMPEEVKKNAYPTLDMHTMFICEIEKYMVK